MPQPMYRPGELLERIEIKREDLQPDGMGGNVRTVNVLHTVRAHVRPMSGSEKADFDTVTAPHMYLFVVRRLEDVFEDDRITWRGTDYNIRSISDRGPRSLYLEMMAEREVAQ